MHTAAILRLPSVQIPQIFLNDEAGRSAFAKRPALRLCSHFRLNPDNVFRFQRARFFLLIENQLEHEVVAGLVGFVHVVQELRELAVVVGLQVVLIVGQDGAGFFFGIGKERALHILLLTIAVEGPLGELLIALIACLLYTSRCV